MQTEVFGYRPAILVPLSGVSSLYSFGDPLGSPRRCSLHFAPQNFGTGKAHHYDRYSAILYIVLTLGSGG